MKEISVNEALRVGKKKASVRFVFPLYITLILSCFILLALNLSLYYIFISFLAGMLLSFYFTTKYLYQWEIWAFQHVRNRHELKRKAKKWGLVPGWEKRLFPPSAPERMMLERLEEKFNQPDIVPDDSHVPEIFEIYYSKSYNRIQLIGWSLGFIGMTYAITELILHHQIQENLMMQIVLGAFWLFSLLFSIENFIQLRTTTPVITLTPEGIQIKRRLFQKADVRDIEISYGKDKTLSVRFHTTKISYPITITDMDIDVRILEDIVEVFVRRWN